MYRFVQYIPLSISRLVVAALLFAPLSGAGFGMLLTSCSHEPVEAPDSGSGSHRGDPSDPSDPSDPDSPEDPFGISESELSDASMRISLGATILRYEDPGTLFSLTDVAQGASTATGSQTLRAESLSSGASISLTSQTPFAELADSPSGAIDPNRLTLTVDSESAPLRRAALLRNDASTLWIVAQTLDGRTMLLVLTLPF